MVEVSTAANKKVIANSVWKFGIYLPWRGAIFLVALKIMSEIPDLNPTLQFSKHFLLKDPMSFQKNDKTPL